MEALVAWIIRQITTEWHVICRAPLTISLAVAIVGGVIWYGVSTYYSSHYQGTISALNATIRSQEERRAQLQDQNTQLRDDLSSARKERVNVQGQSEERRIKKRREFVQALREAGPATLNMNSIAGDRDATKLFADLHDLVIAGGWTIKDKAAVSGTAWSGVHVVVKDRNTPPPGAVLMVELLEQNEIAAVLVGHPDNAVLTLETFSLDIGYKP